MPQHHRRWVSTLVGDFAALVPLELHEVPSGTPGLDWTVPNEWNVRDAYIKNSSGERVIDFQEHNLHLLNYSIPVRGRMPLAELKSHLFTLPDHPDWIPYRTSYYSENWGFCLSQRMLDHLADGEYEVCIDAQLAPGYLTYGEYFIPGLSDDEILISCHCCHPSLANDNLSGMALTVYLARWVGLRAAPVFLPFSIYPRHNRIDHLAGAE